MDHFRSKALGSFATKPPVKLEAMLGSPVCAIRWACSSVQGGEEGEERREKMKTGRQEKGRKTGGMWHGCSSQNKVGCAAVRSKS